MYFNSAEGKPSPDNPWFNVTSPNTTYSWGYDFNHESTATRYFVDRVVEYWLTEFKVDGFRFDFTKGFTNTPGDGGSYDPSRISNLKRIYDKIKSVNTKAVMICEHFAPNTEEKALSDYGIMLWGNSNYNYNEATMGYIQNSDLSWSSYLTRGWNNPNLVSYMESHDEERLMFKNINFGNSNETYNIKDPVTALQRMELAGVFFLPFLDPR
jgi:pullulanase/glycogen debranching enzyme